ncbi:unnamed protein product [Clavelina lepadiformis]|uniref:Uncharacterized protein n=1 Tax=Clavelina lepadiformis TaxID=159417 RepID=A0ABP0GLX7_CLALP
MNVHNLQAFKRLIAYIFTLQELALMAMEHAIAEFDKGAAFPLDLHFQQDVIKFVLQQTEEGTLTSRFAISIRVELEEIENLRLIQEKIKDASTLIITCPSSDETN